MPTEILGALLGLKGSTVKTCHQEFLVRLHLHWFFEVHINILGARDTHQLMSETIVATLLSYIKVKAGQETAYEDMQAVLYRDTWATEPGCRRYEFYRGPERGEYYALLSFDDYQAFLIHQSSDHHEDFGEKFGAIIEDHWVKWVDPMDRGSKGLVPSNPQEPQEDATPLMIQNSQTMPIEVPDWWREQRS